MTQTDPPDLKPKTFKEWLSQPWIGPSISLVVLVVALSSLAVAIATYKRQGDRWAAEDGSLIQLNGSIEPNLTGAGLRIGYAAFYPGREPMRVQTLEIISPSDAAFAPSKDRKALAPLTRLIALDPITGTSEGPSITIELAIRTALTPNEDQGTVIEIEASAVELTGAKQTAVRRAKIMIPPKAVKTPNL